MSISNESLSRKRLEHAMSVSPVSSGPAAAQAAAAAQPKPADAPHDGDSDDVKAAPVAAATAPGVGQVVDKTA
jgi:hypothetical protein